MEEASIQRSTKPSPDRVSVLLSYPKVDLSGVDSARVEVPDRRVNISDWAKTIILALSESPNPSLVPLFPSGIEPTTVFVDEAQNLYLDFPSSVVSVQGGVESEILMLKALFQSIAETMPTIQGVKFLIDGEDRESWGGHVDIQRFFPIRPLSNK